MKVIRKTLTMRKIIYKVYKIYKPKIDDNIFIDLKFLICDQ